MRDLSESEITASDEADARGENFAAVTPMQIHGPNGDYALSKAIFCTNVRRYLQLRDEYLLESGVLPRPLSHWHTK